MDSYRPVTIYRYPIMTGDNKSCSSVLSKVEKFVTKLDHVKIIAKLLNEKFTFAGTHFQSI